MSNPNMLIDFSGLGNMRNYGKSRVQPRLSCRILGHSGSKCTRVKPCLLGFSVGGEPLTQPSKRAWIITLTSINKVGALQGLRQLGMKVHTHNPRWKWEEHEFKASISYMSYTRLCLKKKKTEKRGNGNLSFHYLNSNTNFYSDAVYIP